MKFLITTTPRRLQPPSVGMIEAMKSWLGARLADKTFDCCYGLVTGGGVAIANAESPEKVAQLLMEAPTFMAADWDVKPLCDVNQNLDQVIALIGRMKG